MKDILAPIFDLFCFPLHAKDSKIPGGGTDNAVRSLTLEECVDITLKKTGSGWWPNLP
jgi:hypothetical protein